MGTPGNFVDPKQYDPKFKALSYFIYFGRLEEFKGIRTLIQAISNVKKAELYVLGDGSLRPALQEIVGKGGGSDRIHLLGFKHGEELREIISNSLCTICPSEWYENNPISILESFALGKPVLGAFIGGIPELIEEGVNGLLFKPGNVGELSEKIDYCLKHKNHLRDMGIEARKRVEERYNPMIHYHRIMEKYREMV